MSAETTIAVVVPTFRRPNDLARCLDALADQRRAPDQVVVVVRRGDEATLARCREHRSSLPLETVAVDRSGQVAALNSGLARVRCDLVAFTDDDCRPQPEWIARIHSHFLNDEAVGAVGGRDIVHRSSTPLTVVARRVGRITWFGRLIGNHHAASCRQDVHFLKGANMAYRREVLRGFDERLRGNGAQVHNDLKASLEVWSSGCRVVWDPAVSVNHHAAPRADEDRAHPSLARVREEHHNEVYTLLTVRPARVAFVSAAYSLLVGSTAAPAILLLPRALLRGTLRDVGLRFCAVNLGRLEGVVTAVRASRSARSDAVASANVARLPGGWDV